ncbi:hypothetical protein JS867_000536 [Escherichia coli]|nr:hypothetical protein [Escherichia coli]HAN8831041.1 hypothetical protein [Escherichia coli]
MYGKDSTEFPAPAGINRDSALFDVMVLRVPRASGDKPPFLLSFIKRRGSFPRQRG